MASRISPYVDNTGLVFAYDLANVNRSFPGIPAVNCAFVPENGYNWTVTEITDGSILPPRPGARVFKFECTNASNLHRQGGYYNGGGFGGSNANPLLLGRTSPSNYTTVGANKYRFGMWVRGAASNGSATWTIDIGDLNGTSITVNNNTNWQYISTTDAAGIGSQYPYDFFDINASVGTYYVADYGIFRSPGTVDSLPALQANPQWVDYQQTRSYTTGLKDLTGNSTIDLTNVSFDANAQMTFDGTNDLITLADAAHLKFSNGSFTVEQVLNINSISGKQRTFSKGSSGWTRGWHAAARPTQWEFELSDGVSTPGNGFLINTATTVGTNHVVWVIESAATAKLYVNGVQVGSTQTITESVDFATTTSTVGIGAFESGGEYFNGRIPYTRLYARALPASEIQQNFNAIKGRYGL